jgi:ribosomal-protein-alanine N-acetyltransferase
VSLRTYEPRDFETLFEIDQLCFAPGIAYSREDLRYYFRFPGADCVVAEVNRKIAGFSMSSHQHGKGYIITIDVLRESRRAGIGRALLAELERRLLAQGVRTVGLDTATDNETAIAFWLKHGYRRRGLKKGYYPGGRDAFVMRKTLTPPGSKSKGRE